MTAKEVVAVKEAVAEEAIAEEAAEEDRSNVIQ